MPDEPPTQGKGSYVTKERIDKFGDALEPEESVRYIFKLSALEEGKGDDEESITSLRGWIRIAITNRRLVIKIPKWRGSAERSIPYDSITSLDLNTGLISVKLTLQTKDTVYKAKIAEPGRDECRQAIRFLHWRMENPSEPDRDSSTDPTRQLKNIQELHEDGILSDEEFEAKKEELLDRI